MVFIQKNNLPGIKDGTYVLNLDEFKSIGTHLIALFANNCIILCHRFGVDNIPK